MGSAVLLVSGETGGDAAFLDPSEDCLRGNWDEFAAFWSRGDSGLIGRRWRWAGCSLDCGVVGREVVIEPLGTPMDSSFAARSSALMPLRWLCGL